MFAAENAGETACCFCMFVIMEVNKNVFLQYVAYVVKILTVCFYAFLLKIDDFLYLYACFMRVNMTESIENSQICLKCLHFSLLKQQNVRKSLPRKHRFSVSLIGQTRPLSIKFDIFTC